MRSFKRERDNESFTNTSTPPLRFRLNCMRLSHIIGVIESFADYITRR